MTDFFIGINGGGTRTTLIAVDRTLNILARLETGPSNIHNIGIEAMRATLERGLNELLEQGDLRREDLRGIGAGLSGIDRERPQQQETVRALLANLYPDVPVSVDNDGMIALIAGAGTQRGVVVICGTGSIAMGTDGGAKYARSGGWGYLIDQGSGYWIGRETLTEVARAHDGAAPPTPLSERVLTQLGMSSAVELIAWMYAPDRTITEIAAIAAETVALAETDPSATAIIVRAADAVALNAITVAQRLGLIESGFPLVLSGGLFDHCALLRDRFIEGVRAVLPSVAPILAEREAALGAALMVILDNGGQLPWSISIPEAAPRRATESRNRLSQDIARRPTLDLVRLMNLEDSRIAAILAPQLPMIAACIESIAERYKQGGRLIMLGAGTSGRLAVLDAVECLPTFGVTHHEVMGLLAGGPGAMMGSIENAEDDEADGRAQIAALNVGPLDSIIGVAASGSTPFVKGALREAGERGALTGAIANVVNAPIQALAQYPIAAPVGAEIIMGSTRLRAGTAQKMILNMITTAVMVRVGRTYGNLMTDMQASNIKLRGRAQVIVAEATGLSLDQAAALLERCAGEMKTAIASHLLDVDPDEARLQLTQAKGDLNGLSRKELSGIGKGMDQGQTI